MPLEMRWPLGLHVAVPAFMQRGDAPRLPAGTAASAPVAAEDVGLPARPSQPVAASSIASAVQSSQAPSPAPAVKTRAWKLRTSTIVWLMYFAVLSGLLVRLLVGLVAALRLWRQAEPVLLAHLPLLPMDELPGLRLRASTAVHSPVTVGGGVLLPVEFRAWDAERLRIVLAHEYSHVRQGDFYLQAIAGLHAAVFWFSPLGWWLKRKLSDLSETISDRAAMDEAASPPLTRNFYWNSRPCRAQPLQE